jgi:parallel beta-helix repeat protein
MTRRVSLVLIATLVGWGLSLAPARAATVVRCGQIIRVDTVVANDLINCHRVGLIIGAEGVSLDLNGHLIDGDGVADFEGIQSIGHDNVAVFNGRVRDFVEGIAVVDTDGATVRDLTVSRMRHVGVFVAQSLDVDVTGTHTTSIAFSAVFVTHSSDVDVARNTGSDNGGGVGFNAVSAASIVHNQFVGEECNSVYLYGSSHHNAIADNTIAGGGECEGISITDGSHHNLVARNSVVDSGAGIGLSDADDNVVTDNVLRDNQFVGVYLFGASDNWLARNTVVGNGEGSEGGIHVLSDDRGVASVRNRLSQNLVRLSVGVGIWVEAGSDYTWLDRNVSNGNSDDGIDIEAPHSTLSGNRTDRNRDYGIEAVRGVIDGGGNVAQGNGRPAQCLNVAC